MDIRISLIFLIYLVVNVSGHGRLWEPPARSTMWRRGYNTPVNPNDNELNCGGYMNQWFRLSGKCGVCGDPYNEFPRPNEAGGKYATGVISGEYSTGDVIDLGVQLTANHLGYFEFRICPMGDSNKPVTQNCLDKYPIRIIGSRDGRYHVTRQDHGLVMVRGKLPEGLQCSHCVLQWRYRSGNRWSCDGSSGKCGKGYGSQEEFYGCADVSVTPVDHTQPQLRRGNHRYAAAPAIKRKVINKGRSYTQVQSSVQNVNIHKMSEVLLSLLKVVSKATKSRGRHVANIEWDPIGGLYGKDIVQFNNFKDSSDEVDDWEPRIIEADLPFDVDDHSSFLLSEITSPLDLKTPIRMRDNRIKYPRVFHSIPHHQPRPKKYKTERKCISTQKYRHVNGIHNWCEVNCKAGNCPAAICICQMKRVALTSGDTNINIYRKTQEKRKMYPKSFSSSPFLTSTSYDRTRIRPISKPKLNQRILGKGVFHSRDNSRKLVSHVLNNQAIPNRQKPIASTSKKSIKVKVKSKRCVAVGKFSRRTMDEWCHHHCAKGFCPKSICQCF